MKPIIYSLLLCAIATAAQAQEVHVTGGEVTEVGLYTSRVVTVKGTPCRKHHHGDDGMA